MRQFNALAHTKGFVKAYEAGLKWRRMRNKEEVKRRVDALRFWEMHGLEAAIDHAQVNKRTLQRWKAALKVSGGNVTALDPKSTAPQRRRVRDIPPDLETRIVWYRTTYPRLGGKKLTPLLRKEGYNVSVSYINRCISDLKQRGVLPNKVSVSFYAKSCTHRERPKTKLKSNDVPSNEGLRSIPSSDTLMDENGTLSPLLMLREEWPTQERIPTTPHTVPETFSCDS